VRAKLAKWGNSLAIRLPREAAESVGLTEGAVVDLSVDGDAIVLRRRRYDIADLVAAIDPKQQHPLIEDQPRGGEAW
jgi:antitoxin MazE